MADGALEGGAGRSGSMRRAGSMDEGWLDTGAGVGGFGDDDEVTGKFRNSRVSLGSSGEEETAVTGLRRSALKRSESSVPGGMKRSLTFGGVDDSEGGSDNSGKSESISSSSSSSSREGEGEEQEEGDGEEVVEQRKRTGLFGRFLDLLKGPPMEEDHHEVRKAKMEEHKRRFKGTTMIDKEDKDHMHEEEAKFQEMNAMAVMKAVAVKGATIGQTPLQAQRSKMFQPNPAKMAAGENAYVANRQALRLVHGSRFTQRTVNGKKITPLAKNADRIKAEMEIERAKSASKAATRMGQASRLVEWFDAGLQRTVTSLKIEGKRPLPTGYEIAEWASANVPVIRHKKTGIVTWPIRFDLTPIYEQVEGIKMTTEGRSKQTVFHYTSNAGFKRLIAPPQDYGEDEILEAWEYSEELWERLEQDLERHKLPEIPEAPEDSLALLASEPIKFTSREAIAKAKYRHPKPNLGPGKVGHCVAYLVPADHCMAVSGRLNLHTVVVLPPCADEGDEEDQSKKGRLRGLVEWAKRGKAPEEAIAQKVLVMDLLGGIIDRDTREAVIEQTGEEEEEDQRKGSKDYIKDELDYEEEELQKRLTKLTADRDLLQRKIKHAEKAISRKEAGIDINFLTGDEHRFEKLQTLLQKTERRIAKAQSDLKKLEAKLGKTEEAKTEESRRGAATNMSSTALLVLARKQEQEAILEANEQKRIAAIAITGATAGTPMLVKRGKKSRKKSLKAEGEEGSEESWVEGDSDDEGSSEEEEELEWAPEEEIPQQGSPTSPTSPGRKRIRRVRKATASEFANDVTETVVKISDEYAQLEGDIFREVFGGNLKGVTSWLDSKGNPNEYHSGTGWTPLLMATSMGDPDMVNLLVRHLADPTLGSTEHGWTPMHIAVRKTTSSMVQLILKINDQAARDKAKDGTTPLITTVESAPARARDEVVRILLEAHGDPNAQRQDGWNPLSLAVAKNLRMSVKLLVQNRGSVLEFFPNTEPKITIWQAAARHPRLQALIKSKLNSRDVHLIEKMAQRGWRRDEA